MKKIIFFFCCITQFAKAQNDASAYQQQLHAFYENPDTSPIPENERKDFKGISFFPISDTFQVEAHVVVLKNQKKFKMPSTGKIQQWYKKYAELHFTIDGKEQKLLVYQNLEHKGRNKADKSLFLPFLDDTNGQTSYGGGRYLDIQLNHETTVVIDFNKAYHPYCAYTSGYSCPIVPLENTISAKIEAGEKMEFHEN